MRDKYDQKLWIKTLETTFLNYYWWDHSKHSLIRPDRPTFTNPQQLETHIKLALNRHREYSLVPDKEHQDSNVSNWNQSAYSNSLLTGTNIISPPLIKRPHLHLKIVLVNVYTSHPIEIITTHVVSKKIAEGIKLGNKWASCNTMCIWLRFYHTKE